MGGDGRWLRGHPFVVVRGGGRAVVVGGGCVVGDKFTYGVQDFCK